MTYESMWIEWFRNYYFIWWRYIHILYKQTLFLVRQVWLSFSLPYSMFSIFDDQCLLRPQLNHSYIIVVWIKATITCVHIKKLCFFSIDTNSSIHMGYFLIFFHFLESANFGLSVDAQKICLFFGITRGFGGSTWWENFFGGVNYNMWPELGSSFQKLQTISSSWNSLFFLDVAGTMESICCSFTVHQQ